MPVRKDTKACNITRAIWRTVGVCERCGKTKDEVQLQGAHIYGVGAFPRLKDDLRNGLSLCSQDHRYFTDNPIAFADWIRTTKYEKYLEPLMEKNRTFAKRFWDERIIQLRLIKKAIEEGLDDLDSLRRLES